MEQLKLDHVGKDIFERVISLEQLRTAYRAVRENRGAPGIDGITVEVFGKHLDEELSKLAQEVREWRYSPKPVRRVRIPKSDGGERLLGVPCIRDRVLQGALKIELEPIFERKFSTNSYGFRPGRRQADALQAAKRLVTGGKQWVVDIDLEKFFDTINHDRLIHRISREVDDNRILRLVALTLRSGVMEGEEYEPSEEGATQGSPLSPLLSNIVLDELDKELEERGLEFCRWADDCNIFVGSQKAAERVMKSVTTFIEKRLKLKVNQGKSKVALSSAVKFLGMTITMGMILIATKSMARAMERVKELTPRGTHIPFEKQVKTINRWYTGWGNYFAMTETPSQLANIEAHIRRRLRAQFVRAAKNKRNLVKKLRKMGVSEKHAAKTVYSNRGWWKLSNMPAITKAWNNAWFKSRGLKSLSPQQLPHWQPLNVWIKTS